MNNNYITPRRLHDIFCERMLLVKKPDRESSSSDSEFSGGYDRRLDCEFNVMIKQARVKRKVKKARLSVMDPVDNLIEGNVQLQDNLMEGNVQLQDDRVERNVQLQDDLMEENVQLQDDRVERNVQLQDNLMEGNVQLQDDRVERNVQLQDDLMEGNVQPQDDRVERNVQLQDCVISIKQENGDETQEINVSAQQDNLTVIENKIKLESVLGNLPSENVDEVDQLINNATIIAELSQLHESLVAVGTSVVGSNADVDGYGSKHFTLNTLRTSDNGTISAVDTISKDYTLDTSSGDSYSSPNFLVYEASHSTARQSILAAMIDAPELDSDSNWVECGEPNDSNPVDCSESNDDSNWVDYSESDMTESTFTIN